MHLLSKLLVLLPLCGIQTTLMAAAKQPVAIAILYTVAECVTTGPAAPAQPLPLPEINACVNFPGFVGLSYRAYLEPGAPNGKTCHAVFYRQENCAEFVSDSGTLAPQQEPPAPCIETLLGTKSALVKCD